jgi:hypothetical protein
MRLGRIGDIGAERSGWAGSSGVSDGLIRDEEDVRVESKKQQGFFFVKLQLS